MARVGEKEQNGDVESLNGVLKRDLVQQLLLRGSREFESHEAYRAWLAEVLERRNATRGARLEEERARLRAQYEHAFGKPAGKSTRDRLVRALAARGTAPAQATTSTPTTPTRSPRPTKARDPRLPKAGATLQRVFKGKTYEVVVEHDGFRHAGKHRKSLTAIAREVTGYPAISGPLFWGLTKPAGEPKATKPATPEPAKAPAKKRGRPISAKRKE